MLTYVLGTSEKVSVSDCRTDGCGKNSECIREQAYFVCRCLPGYSSVPDKGCQRGKFSIPSLSLHNKHLHVHCIQYIGFIRSTNAVVH